MILRHLTASKSYTQEIDVSSLSIKNAGIRLCYPDAVYQDLFPREARKSIHHINGSREKY